MASHRRSEHIDHDGNNQRCVFGVSSLQWRWQLFGRSYTVHPTLHQRPRTLIHYGPQLLWPLCLTPSFSLLFRIAWSVSIDLSLHGNWHMEHTSHSSRQRVTPIVEGCVAKWPGLLFVSFLVQFVDNWCSNPKTSCYRLNSFHACPRCSWADGNYTWLDVLLNDGQRNGMPCIACCSSRAHKRSASEWHPSWAISILSVTVTRHAKSGLASN